jgi:hypothetical protein
VTYSIAANLTGCGRDRTRGGVPDEDLHRGQDRGDGERDPEPEPVVAVPAAAQDPGRVDRRDPNPTTM